MVVKPRWDTASVIVSYTFPLGLAWKSVFRANQLHSV